ncbi:hypothetical protein ACQ4PT_062867 [Festuca glaucescens]
MELAISAVTCELVSRFISFLANKYHSHRTYSEEKQVERLQQLLLRAHTVVEEADGRYITNFRMLAQLNMLAEAMYRGYWALGAFRYRSLQETPMEEEQVTYSSPKRFRTVHGSARKNKATYLVNLQGKILVVVELVSNVDEDKWAKFCSTVAIMEGGSKVIILSRLINSQKLGTVKPIFLDTLPYEEFSYLFKTLAFGSVDPVEHPPLARIADEMTRELQSDWSLVAANLLADVLRRNLNLHFWLCMLSRMRRIVERNFAMFGEHPKFLVQRCHQVDVSDFLLHPASPLRIVSSCTTVSSRTEITEERELLPKVRIGDLVVDPGVRPQGDFNVVSWESRVPPYTSFVHFVPGGAPVVAEDTPLSGRKRPAVLL